MVLVAIGTAVSSLIGPRALPILPGLIGALAFGGCLNIGAGCVSFNLKELPCVEIVRLLLSILVLE